MTTLNTTLTTSTAPSALTAGSITNSDLAGDYVYRGSLSGESFDQVLEDGTYTISGMTDGPIGTAAGFLRVTNHAPFWQLQELYKILSPEVSFKRINRPLLGTPEYKDWTLPKAKGKLDKANIVFLGDSITSSYNMPYYLGLASGANVFNYGIGGSRLARHTSAGYKDLSGFKIGKAIKSGVWTDVTAGGTTTNDAGNTNSARMTALSNTDWSTVDYLVIGYGTNDFGGGVTIDASKTEDLTGSLQGYYFNVTVGNMIEDIISTHPHIKVLWWTPLWRGVTPNDPTGITNGTDVSDNTLNNSMQDYIDQIEIKIKYYKQAYIDMYHESGITEATKGHFLNADLLHPTPAGSQWLANKLIAALESKF